MKKGYIVGVAGVALAAVFFMQIAGNSVTGTKSGGVAESSAAQATGVVPEVNEDAMATAAALAGASKSSAENEIDIGADFEKADKGQGNLEQ